jgi:hypothetical protein
MDQDDQISSASIAEFMDIDQEMKFWLSINIDYAEWLSWSEIIISYDALKKLVQEIEDDYLSDD